MSARILHRLIVIQLLVLACQPYPRPRPPEPFDKPQAQQGGHDFQLRQETGEPRQKRP